MTCVHAPSCSFSTSHASPRLPTSPCRRRPSIDRSFLSPHLSSQVPVAAPQPLVPKDKRTARLSSADAASARRLDTCVRKNIVHVAGNCGPSLRPCTCVPPTLTHSHSLSLSRTAISDSADSAYRHRMTRASSVRLVSILALTERLVTHSFSNRIRRRARNLG